MRYLTRLAAAVSFAFLFGPVTLAAQDASAGVAGMEGTYRSDAPLPMVFVPTANPACPISLHAQHGPDGTMRNVDKSRPEGIAQKLHVTLTSKDARQITEARLRVRGASAKGRVSRADMSQNGMDYTRNVKVKLQPGAENQATGDVWVPGMTAVLQVELSSVTFSDGEVQPFGAAQGCRFTPDHLMLIADK